LSVGTVGSSTIPQTSSGTIPTDGTVPTPSTIEFTGGSQRPSCALAASFAGGVGVLGLAVFL
jgi:hypothetical protein